jgi:hypothetical protein
LSIRSGCPAFCPTIGRQGVFAVRQWFHLPAQAFSRNENCDSRNWQSCQILQPAILMGKS